jgi:predicted enzyme related to lactoylglutathione lyase
VEEKSNVGRIAWTDLTVSDAEGIRDFYAKVVQWNPELVEMGDYDDFNMCRPGTEDPAAGICHAKGGNAELPPFWIPYIIVADLERSLSACEELGGQLLVGPKGMGPGSSYAVIQDPAGAVAALYQTGE